MKKIYILSALICCTTTCYSQQSKLLEQYRQMALDYSYDLKAAEKNISASIELEKSARADLKPTLSGETHFQYTGKPFEKILDIPGFDDPLHLEGHHLRYGASLSLSQPIYTGGRIVESIRRSEHQRSLASHQAGLFRSSICYQTDIQYWSTVARREVVTVLTEYRNSIVSLVKTIRERVEVGLVNPQDLLMAEVKLNEAEYQLLQAKSSFETGRMALNSLIGLELNKLTEVEITVPEISFSDEIWLYPNNRSEIRMAHDRIKIAESSLKLTDARYKPQFYVGIEGRYASPGHDFRSGLDPNYVAYAKLSIPLFEWGKRRNEKKASALNIHIATDQLNKTEDSVELEIQTARVSLSQAMERVRLSGSSLEKARENEHKAMERYTEGEVSVTEVIDAQTYRQTSQMNYVQAKAAAQAHYSELIKALGKY